jgi:hypothetical protein
MGDKNQKSIIFTASELQSCMYETDTAGVFAWYNTQMRNRPDNTVPFTNLLFPKLKEILRTTKITSEQSFKASGKKTMRGYCKCEHGGKKINIFCETINFKLGSDLTLFVDSDCAECREFKSFHSF